MKTLPKIFGFELILLLGSLTAHAQQAQTPQQAQICGQLDQAIRKDVLGDGKHDGADIQAIKDSEKAADAMDEELGLVKTSIEAGNGNAAAEQKEQLDEAALERATFSVCTSYKELSCDAHLYKRQLDQYGCQSLENGQAARLMDAQLAAYRGSYDDNACEARVVIDACLRH